MKKVISCGCGCTPVFLGVLFIIFGVLTYLIMGGVFSLTCERLPDGTGYCIHKQDSFLANNEKKILIDDIKKLSLKEKEIFEEDKDDDSEPDYVYTVNIETESNIFPLTPYGSGGKEEKAEIVDKANSFLNDKSQKSLYVEQSGRSLAIATGLILSGIGVFLLVVSVGLMIGSNFLLGFFKS